MTITPTTAARMAEAARLMLEYGFWRLCDAPDAALREYQEFVVNQHQAKKKGKL